MTVSGRRACAVIGRPRATQSRRLLVRNDEEALTAAIVRLATMHGLYGYRRITALLRAEGWRVNLKRVCRIELRDELLNGEIFTTLNEAKVLIERWRSTAGF